MPCPSDPSSAPRRAAGRHAGRAARGLVTTSLILSGMAGVAAAAPAEGFSVDDSRPVRGQAVTFTATDPCVAPVVCLWTGDDGVIGDGPRIAHAYADLGSYEVTLTVDDPGDEAAPSAVTQTVTVVNRPPSATIGVDPGSPFVGQSVTLTATASDPDGDAITLDWSLDGDDAFDDGSNPIVSRVFMTAGPHVVRLRIADGLATDVVSTTVVVGNASPTGSIQASSVQPLTGEGVSFTASGSDPDGGDVTYSWDVDGDGAFGDASGAAVGPYRYDVPGAVVVTVSIVDDEGGHTERSVELAVRNRPPRAGFTATPERPAVGAILRLASSSQDSDGDLVAEQWDLDGDGDFDDASGPTAEKRIEAPVAFSVALKVTDDQGASDVVIRRIDVAAPEPQPGPEPQPVPEPKPVSEPQPAVSPQPMPGPQPVTSPPPTTRARTPIRVLKPFPSVRMAGRLTRRGAAFTLVRVIAPPRTRVSFSCRGGGCPRPSRATVSKTYRINALRGAYRAGAVIEIRVTRSGWVGKYTRMRVHRGKAPSRRDLCLYPSSAKPRACPS